MGPGLRERKKEQTRRALQDAAFGLFARQGFEHTTVDEIADACDVSPRTFFRYFPQKEDVLFGDGDAKRESLADALRTRPAHETPLASLRAAMLELASGYEGDREHLVTRSAILDGEPALRSRGVERQRDWETTITEVLAERDGATGTSHPLLDLRLAAGVATVAMRVACDTWIAEGGDLTPRVAAAFDRIASGLDPAQVPG